MLSEYSLYTLGVICTRKVSRFHQSCCRSLPDASGVLVDQKLCRRIDLSQLRKQHGRQMLKGISAQRFQDATELVLVQICHLRASLRLVVGDHR